MPVQSTRARAGFSFLELFVGIVILFCGIIPIFWVFSSTTREAALTVQQVQATNHATNLMEAVRAAGFDLVSQFPPILVQAEGSKDWKPPEESASLDWAQVAPAAPSASQATAFGAFKAAFMDAGIVPPMETNFRRYLVVRGAGSGGGPSSGGADTSGTPATSTSDAGMIGVTIRVEWTAPAQGEGVGRPQNVELRTVLGNPYRFLGGGS